MMMKSIFRIAYWVSRVVRNTQYALLSPLPTVATLNFMSQLFNQYSAILLFTAVGLAIVALIVSRLPAARRRVGWLVGLAALLFAGLFAFQPDPAGVTASEWTTLLATGGQPVLLELYSDY
jgi:FtsH-binding integral membrane protein